MQRLRSCLALALLLPALAAAETIELKLSVDGLERRALLQLPDDRGARLLPLVVDLHGTTSFPEQQAAISGFGKLAAREGFAVLWPEGHERRWNVPPSPEKPDDVAFVRAALEEAAVQANIDSTRIYVTGFSGGGRLASELACALPEVFAAAAPVGGLRFPPACEHTPPVPIISFHGTADDMNPYDGGGRDYWGTGIPDALSGWVKHNACTDADVQNPAPGIEVSTWKGEGCTPVVFYRLDGFGHQWPGSAIDTRLGPTAPAVPATERIWTFFSAQKK